MYNIGIGHYLLVFYAHSNNAILCHSIMLAKQTDFRFQTENHRANMNHFSAYTLE